MLIRNLLAVVSISLTFNSCCHKKKCVDANKVEIVTFSNFEPTEIDTLVFTSFSKNSAFKIKVDSFFIYDTISKIKGVKEVSLPREMDQQFDWQIKIPGVHSIYGITDFILQQDVCNRCITGNDYYSSLETYRINGVAQVGNIINVQK